MKTRFITLLLSALLGFCVHAITIPVGDSLYRPDFMGTLRTKYEIRTDDGAGRFQVKNAIVGVAGKILPELSYKLEIDFDNNGKVKMRDAYARFSPKSGRAAVTAGLMRVQFGLDVVRSPHLQYFANRSFLAKRGCSVRDVGLSGMYKINGNIPLTLQGGVYSGSSLRDNKEEWSTSYVCNLRLSTEIAKRFGLAASFMRTRPDLSTVLHYDFGAYFDNPLWHIEGEYLYNHYTRNLGTAESSLRHAQFINGFVVRRFPLTHTSALRSVSALCRYDYMSRNSEAKTTSVISPDTHRLTLGSTLHLGVGPVYAEFRLSYEKYFYPNATPTPREDKVTLELMCRF